MFSEFFKTKNLIIITLFGVIFFFILSLFFSYQKLYIALIFSLILIIFNINTKKIILYNLIIFSILLKLIFTFYNPNDYYTILSKTIYEKQFLVGVKNLNMDTEIYGGNMDPNNKDNIRSINIKTDTTFQLVLEAQNRGYRIFWYETKDLNLLNKKVIAKADQIKLFDNSKNYFKKINKINLDLSKTKFVLMRQNPPFNMDYITATFYLEFLKKTKVVNNPKSVRNISEKFYSINFLKMMPPTIFTENIHEIKKFLKKNKKIVIKPIHGFAGKNILFIQNRLNISSISRYLKSFGTVMVQKYLPGVIKGDKRIFI